MGSRKNDEKPLVSKLSAEELFDAIRDPANENCFMADGEIAGEKVVFICSERSGRNGGDVPIALILNAKAAKVLATLIEDAQTTRRDQDDDEDGDDDGDEDVFEP